MARTSFETLVEIFANGRQICNCRQGYLTNCGVGIDSQGNRREDMPACKYGCSANQLDTKNEIAHHCLSLIEESEK